MSFASLTQQLQFGYKDQRRISNDLDSFLRQNSNFRLTKAAMLNSRNERVEIAALVGKMFFVF